MDTYNCPGWEKHSITHFPEFLPIPGLAQVGDGNDVEPRVGMNSSGSTESREKAADWYKNIMLPRLKGLPEVEDEDFEDTTLSYYYMHGHTRLFTFPINLTSGDLFDRILRGMLAPIDRVRDISRIESPECERLIPRGVVLQSGAVIYPNYTDAYSFMYLHLPELAKLIRRRTGIGLPHVLQSFQVSYIRMQRNLMDFVQSVTQDTDKVLRNVLGL